jgi:hypothetical protein
MNIIHPNSTVYYYICGAAPPMKRHNLTRELMLRESQEKVGKVGKNRDGIKPVKPVTKKGDGRLSKYV